MNHLAPVSITASGGMGGGVHARQGALVLPSSALDDVAGRTALHASELATLQTLAGETMLMGEAVTQQLRKKPSRRHNLDGARSLSLPGSCSLFMLSRLVISHE